jgi:hypothetical protein
MKRTQLTALALGWLAVCGCAVADEPGDVPTKDDLATGKADIFSWCSWLGAGPDCDLCAEMGWYGDDDCDATLVAIGACREPDPDCDSPYCFLTHMEEAIAINEERKPLYAALTDDESLKVSNALIRNERLARPVAVVFDMRARSFQAAGIDIICDEFVSMELTPAFEAQSDVPSAAFEKTSGYGLAWRLSTTFMRNGYAGLTSAVEEELAALAPTPEYHCMVRHILESILRAANLAPLHVREAELLGMDSPAAISRDFIAAQIATIPAAAGIDEDAAPIQARGIPIVCQDVPPIPPHL